MFEILNNKLVDNKCMYVWGLNTLHYIYKTKFKSMCYVRLFFKTNLNTVSRSEYCDCT